MAIQHADQEFVGLTEAAERLGVHRATVNDMVLSRRLRGRRRRGQWYVDLRELEAFAATYVRPPNAPRPRGRSISDAGQEILALLCEWGDATVAELGEVVSVHEGNIRKQLRLLEARGLAVRDELGTWKPAQVDAPGTEDPVASVI